MAVPALAALLGDSNRKWDPILESAILGTGDPKEIADLIEAFVTRHCGAVSEGIFYRPGVGIVAGLRLVNGSEVVVKIHRWNVSLDRLIAIQKVQTTLADDGLPVPRPLAEPERLVNGIATVEELRPGGGASGRDPAVRRAIAEGLHWFIRGHTSRGGGERRSATHVETQWILRCGSSLTMCVSTSRARLGGGMD